jgi:hypothetical protein
MPKVLTVIMKDEVDEIAETFPVYRRAGSLGEDAAAGQIGIDSHRECPAHRILKSG